MLPIETKLNQQKSWDFKIADNKLNVQTSGKRLQESFNNRPQITSLDLIVKPLYFK